MYGSLVRLDIPHPHYHAPSEITLLALVGGILVDASGVERNGFSVCISHCGGLDLCAAVLSNSDLC